MTQSEYAYPVPAGLSVISSFPVPGHEYPIAKVACSCCNRSTPVTTDSTLKTKVVCAYCRRTCKGGPHVDCEGCCMGDT